MSINREGATSISFRQIKLFETVGRLKSVRRASEECNLSQPAVTQALFKLEQQVGACLLERRARGSYLNQLGEIFHRRATRLFAQMEQALADLGIPAAAAPTIVKRISRAQVRVLVAIVESGSFSLAAEALGLSQASLQRAARELESNLRKPLYCRTAAGLVVTPAGAEFGRKMKVAAQEIDWGVEELEAALGVSNTQIVIGALPFGGSVLLASVLDDFIALHPNADVKIINETAPEMMRKLHAGDVDFVMGLVQETTGDELAHETFAHTPYVVAARRGHPLQRQGKLTIDDLLTHDWVAGTPGSSRRACFERLFPGAKAPKTPITTCALPVVRHLLARSNRLTLMTSYEVMHESQLVALPFGPIEPAPAIGVTMRANWLPTRLHADFIGLVRGRFSDAATPGVAAA